MAVSANLEHGRCRPRSAALFQEDEDANAKTAAPLEHPIRAKVSAGESRRDFTEALHLFTDSHNAAHISPIDVMCPMASISYQSVVIAA